MERRRWAHGHISAFTSCAMVGRSLFFLTLESYFAFCGEKVGYQCFLQSKILSLISNYNIFSIEFRAGPEMNKILKSTFFHATFYFMEIRHCPWKAVTVLTIRRNQESYLGKLKKILRLTFKHHIEIPWLRSTWLAALVFRSNIKFNLMMEPYLDLRQSWCSVLLS